MTDAWIRARVEHPQRGRAAIERVGRLTAYLAQTIVEDALAAGPGGTLDLEWARASGSRVPEALRQSIAGLTRRGIEVRTRTVAWRPPPSARSRAA